jgi:hypothetical protein
LIVEYGECRGEGFLGIVANNNTLPGARSPKVTSTSGLSGLLSSSNSAGFNSSGSSQSRLSQVADGLKDQAAGLQRMKDIVTLFQQKGVTPNEKHYIAAAMAAGLSKAASYSAMNTGGLDTHSNHVGVHLGLQTQAWQDVAALLEIFRATPLGTTGESLFDRTTFFVTSEFSRTAALNPSGGKDHNPLCNSALIISPNVRNTTVGGSRLITKAASKTPMSYHIASPIDLQTGLALDSRDNAFIIRPENVAATVMELMGISRRRFAPVGPKVSSLTHLLRR